jgi:hypothetical protein
MDQDRTQGGEDNRDAVEHTQNAHENLEALRDQNRRTEATAGDSANHPIEQTNDHGPGAGLGGGLNTTVATGRSSEDNSQASANTQHAHENRDALADQARRTDATTPDEARKPIGE